MKFLTCDVCGATEENADYEGNREKFYFEESHKGAPIQMEIVVLSALDLCYGCVTKIALGKPLGEDM